MSLLEKFDAVVVQADNRISETDKYFCETHQEAYEAALSRSMRVIASGFL